MLKLSVFLTITLCSTTPKISADKKTLPEAKKVLEELSTHYRTFRYGNITKPPNDICQRLGLTVNLKKLDESIKEPEYLEIGYCYGSCQTPALFFSNWTSYAYLRTLQHDDPDPFLTPYGITCNCLPYEYTPVSVTYNEPGGKEDQKQVPDLVVKSCQCA